MAKQHKDKFTHISPVWYQLRVQEGAPYLTGGHDVDAEWMGALRAPADDVSLCAQIMLRDLIHGAHQLIYFHAFTLNVLIASQVRGPYSCMVRL